MESSELTGGIAAFWGCGTIQRLCSALRFGTLLGGLWPSGGGCNISGVWDHFGGLGPFWGVYGWDSCKSSGWKMDSSISIPKIAPGEQGSGSSPPSPERQHRGEHLPSLTPSPSILPIDNDPFPLSCRHSGLGGVGLPLGDGLGGNAGGKGRCELATPVLCMALVEFTVQPRGQ